MPSTWNSFKSRITIQENGCWIGNRLDSKGYAWFRYKGESRHGYSVAYEIMTGKRVKGHKTELHHTCENKACWNPFHLEELSPSKHKELHGGNNNSKKTHCPRGHIYDQSNTLIYKGWRRCRVCIKMHNDNRTDAGRNRLWLMTP